MSVVGRAWIERRSGQARPGFAPVFPRIIHSTLVALALESRAKVDEMVKKAIAAGGSEYREKQDYGWMYGRAFKDLDGHIWEPFYMDMNAMPEEMKNKK